MRMRATVAELTSRAAPMAASVQLGPASPWLAFSRMRAWVRALAGATPRPIMVCSQARSSSVRTTTCRLRTSASYGVEPPEPHEDEGQPPTTQLKADELLASAVSAPRDALTDAQQTFLRRAAPRVPFGCAAEAHPLDRWAPRPCIQPFERRAGRSHSS